MKNIIKRKFSLGSEWLYVKIYTGYKTADDLLAKDLFPFANSLLKKGLIKKYFFIRFTDPFYHIRFRIHIADLSSMGIIILQLNKILDLKLQKNLVTKIQYDTYTRELERYHHFLIEEVESLFFCDSLYIIKIIKKIIKNEQEDHRWIASIILITSFLDCAGLSTEDKYKLMKKLAESFKSEFGFNLYNSKQFNIKYREHKKTIEEVINKVFIQNGFENIYIDINKRADEITPIIRRIKMQCTANNLNYNECLENYIHMSINRLFPVKNRLHELLVYDFLSRYYNSKIIREKSIKYV